MRFTKMVAAGNDFVVLDARQLKGAAPALARRVCDRTCGIGADGMLVMGDSKKADARMRVFNADGSEAEMCGNGARCAALYAGARRQAKGGIKNITLETKAGIIEAIVQKKTVKIRLTDPRDMRFDIPIEVNGRRLRVNFIDTGVPHVVIFAAGLQDMDVRAIGRAVRRHRAFEPRGANVNFVEEARRDGLRVRTYERGVEDETRACGTGSAAAALMYAAKSRAPSPVRVLTRGGETLTVYFRNTGDSFSDVWLEGMPRVVYTGDYHEL